MSGGYDILTSNPASDSRGAVVRVAGTVTTSSSSTAPSTPALTSVGDSASAVQLLAANSSRKDAMITNTSSAALYIGLTSGAGGSQPEVTTSLYTVKLNQFDYYELPKDNDGKVYTGAIRGIWASDAGGQANITELT